MIVEQTKYKAKKVIIRNGMIIQFEKGMVINPGDEKFDSKLEAQFYLYLLELQAKGSIAGFDRQPKFVLQEAFVKNGVKFQPITYIADYLVYYPDGRKKVIDVKGMEDQKFQIKKKMFEYKYPELTLVLMKYVKKFGGWISNEKWKQMKAQEEKVKKNA